jgi:hypothetical protein
MTKGYWTYSPKPAKLTKYDKEEIRKKVTQYIESTIKLKERVSRIEIKTGRIYLYEGNLQDCIKFMDQEGCVWFCAT